MKITAGAKCPLPVMFNQQQSVRRGIACPIDDEQVTMDNTQFGSIVADETEKESGGGMLDQQTIEVEGGLLILHGR